MNHDIFLKTILLYMIQSINGQRSIKGVIHILIGKQNHQTWSDLHLFQLQSFYRFLSNKEESFLMGILTDLIRNKLLLLQENEVCVLTEEGIKFLTKNMYLLGEISRDGRVIAEMEEFWSYVHLLVQTLSNLLEKHSHFLPVVRNTSIQMKVKQWLSVNGVQKGASGLLQELKDLFHVLSDREKQMLLLRLSGYDRIAFTLHQLAKHFQTSYFEMKWLWDSTLTTLYFQLQNKKYDFLPKVQAVDEILISNSCRETYRLIQKGKDITKISQIRRLKESTIMDHIIEITLAIPSFDTKPFLSKTEIDQVKNIFLDTRSFRLTTYKSRLTHLSYFQIRLALILVNKEVHDEIKSISKKSIWI